MDNLQKLVRKQQIQRSVKAVKALNLKKPDMTKRGPEMTLRIITVSTLHGLEAEIRKTTFEAIHRLKNLGVPIGECFVIVGDPFDGAYVLRFISDDAGEPDILYVSPDVKRQFYADKATLEIRAV